MDRRVPTGRSLGGGLKSKPEAARATVELMAAKSRSRAFAGGFLQVAFLVCLLLRRANAHDANAGTAYLDRKESDVKAIAGNATANNANCGSLNGCSSACSHVTCQPLSTDFDSLICTVVDNNENFDVCPSGACSNKMKLDYNRSFVTLAAPASLDLDTEVARDICLQRQLDSTFKSVSFQTEYTYVYFGSSSGPFRAFPGREQNATQCTTFETRKRPWYLNGISDSKDVKILVDVSNTMGSVLPVEYQRLPSNTYLDAAKNITQEVLQTFLAQDYVEVIAFNSTDAVSLGGPVQMSASFNYLNPAGRPELQPLMASVNNLAASSNAAQSDLNKAIIQATSSFNTADQLKVIVVLSDGLFIPLNSTTFPSAKLLSLRAKLMVYKLPTNGDSGDPYLLQTPSLQENLCAVNGSFERFNALDTANPLYAVRSYFTFLARAQLASVDNNATWSNIYSSFAQDDNAVTVTYPAFGSDGLLIGVAGVDVVIGNLPEPLQDQVYAEFQSRNRGTQSPGVIPMACSYQSAPANTLCAGSTPPDSSAICVKTDTSSLADRTCCGYGTCGSTGHGNHLKTVYIVLIGLAAGLVVIGIVAGLCWRRHKELRRKQKPDIPPEPDFGDGKGLAAGG